MEGYKTRARLGTGILLAGKSYLGLEKKHKYMMLLQSSDDLTSR